ncbi:hypothetical protein GEMRC1_002151 [Eukaryota sp. GEM-RC1]
MISTQHLTSNIEVFPHSFDFTLGSIHYDKLISNSDLISLLNVVKSNFPINRIQCLGCHRLTLGIVVTYFKIQQLNRTVLHLDVSPNFVDLESGVFVYTAKHRFLLLSDDVLLMVSFLKDFQLKEITLQRCRFSDDTVAILSDLIKQKNSLTIVDFRFCGLCPDHLYKILNTFDLNTGSNLTRINLDSNSLGNEGALVLAEVLKNCSSMVNINLRYNSIGKEGALALANVLEADSSVLIKLEGNNMDIETRQLVSSTSHNRIIF